jgi:hypothetical protein
VSHFPLLFYAGQPRTEKNPPCLPARWQIENKTPPHFSRPSAFSLTRVARAHITIDIRDLPVLVLSAFCFSVWRWCWLFVFVDLACLARARLRISLRSTSAPWRRSGSPWRSASRPSRAHRFFRPLRSPLYGAFCMCMHVLCAPCLSRSLSLYAALSPSCDVGLALLALLTGSASWGAASSTFVPAIARVHVRAYVHACACMRTHLDRGIRGVSQASETPAQCLERRSQRRSEE